MILTSDSLNIAPDERVFNVTPTAREVVYDFRFTIDTTKAGVSGTNTFRLPLVSGQSYDFIVAWGDGTTDRITSYDQAEATHTYAAGGIKHPSIRFGRAFGGWAFKGDGDCLKLMDVIRWGKLPFGNTSGAFYGCANLTTLTASDAPIFTTNATCLEFFRGCSNLNSSIGSWDVGNVTDMSFMFYGASVFNQSLASWDVSSVTNFLAMFRGCKAFNGDISAWNTGNATSFAQMFFSASAFNQNIGAWDMSKATDLTHMLSGASSFNQNIGAWNTSNVTSMSSMFQNASSYNNGGSATIGTWNTSKVTTMSNMFNSAYTFNQDISGWDVSSVTTLQSMFNGARTFQQNLGAWSPLAITTAATMFSSADVTHGGDLSNYDNLLLGWAAKGVPNSISFGAASCRYTHVGLGDASTGRTHLTTAIGSGGHGWTITDSGSAVCTFSNASGKLLATYTGDKPTYSRMIFSTNGTLPTGLTAGVEYWTVRVSSTTARLATSLANAQANTTIGYTDSGSGTHSAQVKSHVFTASNSSGHLLLTFTTGAELTFSGRKYRFVTSNTLPTGISAGVDYYLNRASATTYRVCTTPKDAVNGTNYIAYTDAGTGSHEAIRQ